MNNQQTKLIVVLSGILLAVLVASALIITLLPNDEDDLVPEADTTPTTSVLPGGTVPSTSGFNTRVLETAGYTILDKRPITEGAIPVQPPVTTGKANPFL